VAEGWAWIEPDARDIPGAAARLHGVAASLDPGARRTWLERLQNAIHLATAVNDSAGKQAKYVQLRDQLAWEREQLLARGDPIAAVAQAVDQMRAARKAEQLARVAIAAHRVEREENERLLASLRQHVDDPMCPTCARPLGAAEAQRLVALLAARIESLKHDERKQNELALQAAQDVSLAERDEAEARQRQEAIRTLDQRLADGQNLIDEENARHDGAVNDLEMALRAIGLSHIPAPDVIAEMQRDVERVQQIAGLAPLLARLHQDAQETQSARETGEAELREIGAVQYEATQHQAASDALREARRAAAQVEQIDVELASRPTYERQRDNEGRTIGVLGAEREVLCAKRAALSYAAASLQAAVASELAARVAANEAQAANAAARQTTRDARIGLERLQAEHAHLQMLIESADAKAREADELSRMYDEFAEFDRYVARHVGPLLAETTERMLSQVTNGKYDHVQFDENYGIEVFDGDQAFPIGSFSGGERDVVALCARLALSEVVGSAALRPPRFLVLDEVFGSLDSERRAQLLETLGSLADGGHFRQMFIISHIDDVQFSPVMSEAWTVEERDGVSHVARPQVLNLERA
jgi:exonuclease SbcC